jgi:adenosylcobyric acid synthase
VVVIEGAGSPAEVNLKSRDIVNMFVAEIADAPVLLVGDIDRGGVFAAFVGTLELLEPHERARVVAFVVNKFRGDRVLLEPGLDFLTARTGVPVLGVLPYVQRLRVADEDSVSLDDRRDRRRARPDEVEIAVIRLPRISNYDDFQPLEHEPGVVVRFVEHVEALESADLVILPGTKSTLADLGWLRQTGIAAAVTERALKGGLVLGVCGGCQMLGGAIFDPHRTESEVESGEGLGLLGLLTQFERGKRVTQVRARMANVSFLCTDRATAISGYEIHAGRVTRAATLRCAVFAITARNACAEDDVDGAISSEGNVVGTMIHGLFENEPIRRSLLAALRSRKGLSEPIRTSAPAGAPDEFDRLASVVRDNVDMAMLLGWIGR